MKRKLLTAFALLAAGLVAASAAETKTFTVQNKPRGRTQRQQPNLSRQKAIGAFPRVSHGNPLQLFNPRAPQRYFGPPQETVVFDTANYEANHHPQVSGLILFGLAW
ncbi:MAG: hypothetical protein ACXV9Q_09255 [Chthoniobacterales bacterium]